MKGPLDSQPTGLLSDACLYLSMILTDHYHVLSPQQLFMYARLRKVKNSVFHKFVPVSLVEKHVEKHREETSERYVLLIGAPWYLKGADLLVEAFRRLAPDFPQVKLKIMGKSPEGDKPHDLTEGAPQIEGSGSHRGDAISGIPFMIDGKNDFVVPGADSRSLEARPRKFLSNAEMGRRMGDTRYRRVYEEFDEKSYVEHSTRMVEATVKGSE